MEMIPTGFWNSKVLQGSLPENLCNKIVDGNHWRICKTKEFHYNHSHKDCKCEVCGEPAEWFHKCSMQFTMTVKH